MMGYDEVVFTQQRKKFISSSPFLSSSLPVSSSSTLSIGISLTQPLGFLHSVVMLCVPFMKAWNNVAIVGIVFAIRTASFFSCYC